MSDLIKIVIGAVLGFVSSIIVGKLSEHRSKLEHELGSAATFSDFSPQASFQELRIANTGKTPLTGIRAVFRTEAITSAGTEIKVKGDEDHTEEVMGEHTALVFERLVPTEFVEIVFKSQKPLTDGFLVSVKSKEVISKPVSSASSGKSELPGILSNLFPAAFMLGFAIAYLFFNWRPFESEQSSRPFPEAEITIPEDQPSPSMLLSLSSRKQPFSPGDSIVIDCMATNPGRMMLRDVRIFFFAHGFDVGFDDNLFRIDFLDCGSSRNWQVAFPVDSGVPAGNHPISLDASGYIDDSLVFAQVEGQIRIR
jgi:hypothetical protein